MVKTPTKKPAKKTTVTPSVKSKPTIKDAVKEPVTEPVKADPAWLFNPKRPLGLTEVTELFQMMRIVLTGQDVFDRCTPKMKQHFEEIK
jgi:hypothetical protein